ncbi:hypothetical protein [Sphingobacterium bambusae]|uniref:Uncharacterized protein n=1 Tax=Sphingobacterium bambusae TaxID=662858 RepID=A0ABW6BLX4_9SPHI|nr:hypothetical protein [Sphingobacterium bambusae]WPL49924.1 hypothetical protein SCB77_05575 [Sphingobacterium bambusae]
MELIKRLDKYNLHYGFLEDSKDFSFEVHPERIIIRNDALRTKDRKLYADYLAQKFPDRLEEALSSYDSTAANLFKLTKTEAKAIFKKNGVNLLRSDISMLEQDAIFTAQVVPQEVLPSEEEDTNMKLIHNKIFPEKVFDRPYIWIDASCLSNVNLST